MVWQDMFHLPCFWHSPRGSSMILQGQTSVWVRWYLQNEKWICLETFLITCIEILCCVNINSCHHQAWWQSVWKCWLVANCLYNFKCLQMFVSTLHTCLHNIAVPDYFLWAIFKVRYTEHVLEVDVELQQWIQECIKGISKEMPQCVMTSFILWLQECTEQHGGHLQSVIFKQ